MWPRLSILLGLLAGVAAGALMLGALLFLTPDPGSGATPMPSPSAPPSAVPSATTAPSATGLPSPSPSAVPSARAVPSATALPSASANPSASPLSSAAAALLRIGEPAPALVVPKVGDKDGIVRDGALGGIGPDAMARGVSTILPAVEVTP